MNGAPASKGVITPSLRPKALETWQRQRGTHLSMVVVGEPMLAVVVVTMTL